jgi:hypothetical protein
MSASDSGKLAKQEDRAGSMVKKEAGIFQHNRIVMDRMRSIAFALLTPLYLLKADSLVSLPAERQVPCLTSVYIRLGVFLRGS